MPQRADDHQKWMQRALELAACGRGWVEPNPMVGAVVVRDGEVLGEGFHARFGGPHAEIQSLRACRDAGHDPTDATLYVNLEPCCHHGKTPPCADALIEAKLARVVVAMQDPFDQVAGRGIARLRDAGVDVRLGVCEREARQLNEPYIKRVTTGLPWVIVKWAQTLDGRIATAAGQSKWISSDASRRRVHELRARVDAIVIGIGTALADDPQLTARDVEIRRVARRVIVDPQRRLAPDCRLLAQPHPPVTIATRADAAPVGPAVPAAHDVRPDFSAACGLAPADLELLPLPPLTDNRLDLRPLLQHLAEQHNATNVLVEGGAALVGSLFDQNLVDQVLVFVAPTIAGDPAALGAVNLAPLESIHHARRLSLRTIERIGDDILLDYCAH